MILGSGKLAFGVKVEDYKIPAFDFEEFTFDISFKPPTRWERLKAAFSLRTRIADGLEWLSIKVRGYDTKI